MCARKLSGSYFFFVPFDKVRNVRLQLIDANPDLTLRLFRGALEPEIINLRQHAVLTRHPSVAKKLPIRFALHRRRFLAERRKKFSGGAFQRRRRVIRQPGNAIHDREKKNRQIEQGSRAPKTPAAPSEKLTA